MSKVSVIIPIYNPGKTLNKCIKSMLHQTFNDFELILINDGSTDNSLEICNKYSKIDSRIKVINKENEGSIATRRAGVEIAKGEYIMFSDADDWVDENIVEILYNEAIDNKCDIVVCNMCKVTSDKAIIKKVNNSLYFKENKIYKGNEIKEKVVPAYLHGHPFPSSNCAKLYRRNLILSCGKYLDRIEFLGDDLFYNLEIFLKADRVKLINQPLYYYRAGGFTSKYMPYHFSDIVNGYEIQKEVIEEYYKDTYQKHCNGISIMLLNSLKTSLSNIVNSNLDELKIKENIHAYTLNSSIIESIENEGSKRYFEKEFLDAIRENDVNYLYKLGKLLNNKYKIRKKIISIISKLNIF